MNHFDYLKTCWHEIVLEFLSGQVSLIFFIMLFNRSDRSRCNIKMCDFICESIKFEGFGSNHTHLHYVLKKLQLRRFIQCTLSFDIFNQFRQTFVRNLLRRTVIDWTNGVCNLCNYFLNSLQYSPCLSSALVITSVIFLWKWHLF